MHEIERRLSDPNRARPTVRLASAIGVVPAKNLLFSPAALATLESIDDMGAIINRVEIFADPGFAAWAAISRAFNAVLVEAGACTDKVRAAQLVLDFCKGQPAGSMIAFQPPAP
ncbi:hypothetical protein [Geminicoccus sp.]|uniref:hypothetical protein n=1 Tax=Geminicoccus sp. TaxID=2024832 RepID=UPI002E2F24C5|nr:hypothetical protein [Geminicoccus sp.]